MKTITERQAVNYIIAGIFPEDDYAHLPDICDLQDMFGHLSYRFIISLLADERTKPNAERLFRMLWNNEQTDGLVKEAEKYLDLLKQKQKLERELESVEENLVYIHCTSIMF